MPFVFKRNLNMGNASDASINAWWFGFMRQART